MDWPIGGRIATIVSLCDGSASVIRLVHSGSSVALGTRVCVQRRL